MTGADEPVVGILEEEWEAIVPLALELGDGEWDLPSECPGWTVRDVLSHLIGTERTLLGDPAPRHSTEFPPHVENEVGARNEAWVATRRSRPGREVLEEFRDVTARRLGELRSWPAVRFDEVGPEPRGRGPVPGVHARPGDGLLGPRAGHPRGHRAGPATTRDLPRSSSLHRLASAMPFVVGKQAGAPDGACVRFELRGSLPRRIDVVVRDGRAKAVDRHHGDPRRRPRHGHRGLLAPGVRSGGRARPPASPGSSRWAATSSSRRVCSTPWRS